MTGALLGAYLLAGRPAPAAPAAPPGPAAPATPVERIAPVPPGPVVDAPPAAVVNEPLPAGLTLQRPALAAGPAGAAIACFERRRIGSGSEEPVSIIHQPATIICRRIDFLGRPEGAETALAQGAAPSVAALPAGGFLLVWSSGEAERGVWARALGAAGLPAGDPFRLDEPGRDARFPAVVADAGGAAVAWTALDGAGNRSLFARHLDASGTPDGDVIAVSQSGNVTSRPALAMTREGGLGIAWAASSGHAGGQALARLFAPGGTPLSGEISLGSATRLCSPAIAAHSGAGFLVVWELGSAIEGALLEGQAGHPRTFAVVAPEAGVLRSDPSVATTGQGEILATWQERSGRSSGIRCRFFLPSRLVPLAPPSWLAPPGEGFALSASVQAGAAGTYLALWDRTPNVVARHLSRPATTSRPMTAAQVACWRSHLGQALARLGPPRTAGSATELALVPAVNGTVVGMLRAAMLQSTPATAPGDPGSPSASAPADPSPRGFSLDLARGELHKVAGALDASSPSLPTLRPARPPGASPGDGRTAPVPVCTVSLSERDLAALAWLAEAVHPLSTRPIAVTLFRGEGIDTFEIELHPWAGFDPTEPSLRAEIELDLLPADGHATGRLRILGGGPQPAQEKGAPPALPPALGLVVFPRAGGPPQTLTVGFPSRGFTAEAALSW